MNNKILCALSLFCSLLLATYLSGCGSSTDPLGLSALTNSVATTTATTQTWQFISEAGTATAQIQGGAGTATGWVVTPAPGMDPWTLQFGVQFSGKQVRLLTFRPVTGTSTGKVSMIGNGTGTANGDFGAANTAQGTVTFNWQSPIGATSGTGNWTAVRVK